MWYRTALSPRLSMGAGASLLTGLRQSQRSLLSMGFALLFSQSPSSHVAQAKKRTG